VRPQNQKIAAVGLAAQPLKSFVEIAAAAHHGDSSVGVNLEILRISLSNVLKVSRMAHSGAVRKKQSEYARPSVMI
jgi:hypothetical protein